MHANIGIFGDQELAKKLAKAGTTNDIAIYNHASSEGVFSYIYPNSDKLQPLLQVIGMTDFPIVVFREMTKEFGEQIVAADAARFENGFLVDAGVGEEKIKQSVKGTSLERFTILPNEPAAIRQAVIGTAIKRDNASEPWLPIDNYFDVKGVGTVVLTVVKKGKIKKYDTLRLEPIGKEVLVKGMQSQDKDVTEAEAGVRLGVNIKGVEIDDLKRGYVLCKSAIVSKSIKIKFSRSRYSREQLEKGSQLFVACGLQIVAGTAEDVSGDVISISLERTIAHQQGEKCIIGSTKQTLPRILGSGVISES